MTTLASVVALSTHVTAGNPTPPTFPNLAYSSSHFRHRLDLYLPGQSECGLAPLVIFVPGGGWLTGDKSDVSEHVDSLLARGFAVAAINHRYSYQAIWPAQIHDCKGAVRWLRANATQYGFDGNRIAVFGSSSGGHLAALVGTTGDTNEVEGSIGGNLTYSSTVQAVGDFYGPTDLFELGTVPPHDSNDSIISQLFDHPIQDIINNRENPAYADLVALVESANPVTFVTSSDPPMYISHGEEDTFVPTSQSQLLNDALVAAKVPVTFRVVPGEAHGLPLSEYELLFDFFAAEFAQSPRPSDINCDGVVDVADLLLLIDAWGPCPGKGSPCPADIAPANQLDGLVNVDDLLAILNNWG